MQSYNNQIIFIFRLFMSISVTSNDFRDYFSSLAWGKRALRLKNAKTSTNMIINMTLQSLNN